MWIWAKENTMAHKWKEMFLDKVCPRISSRRFVYIFYLPFCPCCVSHKVVEVHCFLSAIYTPIQFILLIHSLTTIIRNIIRNIVDVKDAKMS